MTELQKKNEESLQDVAERLFPAPPSDATPVDARALVVTLLEDRAMVRRSAVVKLSRGENRVMVMGVAPVLQDVSLRAEVVSGPEARVVDVRVRRAMRVRRADRPAEARAMEEEIRALHRRILETQEDQSRSVQRHARAHEELALGLGELATDAGWGMITAQLLHDGFENLFSAARALRVSVLDRHFEAEDLSRELHALADRRRALDRIDTAFVAWIEADLVADRELEATLSFEYVVPNALWRPMHTATLADDGTLRFASNAVVWQNTGEDWVDAELVFSTARSSLGTEPPLLGDDLLSAQKKSDQVVVARREVEVQRAGDGARPPSDAIELPGVDDGGEIRTLTSKTKRTVPSDGRPTTVLLFAFDSPTERVFTCTPELVPKVFLQSTQTNRAAFPILAGPVELVRENGFVGWTKVLFVAPKEKFRLSFGPERALRVVRDVRDEREVEPIGKWTVETRRTNLYLSNLGGEPRTIELLERIPVSEVEEVRVAIVELETNPETRADVQGFCRWSIELAGNSRAVVLLCHETRTAPGVKTA